MNIHAASRREDLLVGSLVSTMAICAVVWLDQGHGLRALPHVTEIIPAPKPFIIPPDQVVTEDPIVRAKVVAQPDPVPQIRDLPQPIPVHAFVQPIEPPAPDNPISSPVIPTNWSSTQPGIEIFNPGLLDQQPTPTHQAKPVYPFEMRQKGFSGTVLVDFIVDTDGNVRNATAVRSTMPEFEASAVSAVGKWKFKPGRKANHAVFTHMQVPIEFTLNDSN